MPVYFGGSGTSSGPGTRVSFMFKVNTYLTHDTALVDLDGGVLAYLRVDWSVEAGLVAEVRYRGIAGEIFLCPGFTLVANEWYWVSVAIAGRTGAGSGGKMLLGGQVWGASSGTPGGVGTEINISAAVGLPSLGFEAVDCGVGWGVPLSSDLNPFPKAPGDEFTELCIESSPAIITGFLGVPSAPLTPSSQPNIIALYHCDEPLGANRIIHDATSNHYDLSPGPQGNQILADSPF